MVRQFTKMVIKVPAISVDDLVNFHFQKFNSLPTHMATNNSVNSHQPSNQTSHQTSSINCNHTKASVNNYSNNDEPDSDISLSESVSLNTTTRFHHDGTLCTLTDQEISYFRQQEVHKREFFREQKAREKKLKGKKGLKKHLRKNEEQEEKEKGDENEKLDGKRENYGGAEEENEKTVKKVKI